MIKRRYFVVESGHVWCQRDVTISNILWHVECRCKDRVRPLELDDVVAS